MFRKIFARKPAQMPETQRQRLTRALAEVNEVIETLDPPLALTVNMGDGKLEFTLPDQFPDEAPALPAPQAVAPAAVASPA